MMQPKFTVKLDTEQKPMSQSGPDSVPVPNSMVFDMDFTNMQRLEEELKAAIKSVDAQYPRKVQKFIKWTLYRSDQLLNKQFGD